MSQAIDQSRQPSCPPRFRRWWLYLGIIPLVILGPLLAIHFIDCAAADRALEEAIAEADRLDPGWRLEDIEAKRRQIPDEKNGALIVLSAHRRLPGNWFNVVEKIEDKLIHPPPVRMDNNLAKELRAALEPAAQAITEARRLAHFRDGRFPINYAPIPMDTSTKDRQKTRDIGWLLAYDGWHLLQEGKFEAAWTSSRAILNTARSLGDEPLLITQLLRIVLRRFAVSFMERTLAQGIISEPHLEDIQIALTEEAGEPLLLHVFRGARAGAYKKFLHWEKIGVPWDQLPVSGRGGYWNGARERIAGKTAKLKEGNAWTLTFYTKGIEDLKKPGVPRHKLLIIFHKIMQEWDKEPVGWLLLVTPFSIQFEFEMCREMPLHCAFSGIAAERFRLQRNRWPNSLDELVKAGLLNEIPIDLMDGKPLRFRRTIDGLVIYSIGADGKYRGDALDDLSKYDPHQERSEFRLWDVTSRGQASAKP